MSKDERLSRTSTTPIEKLEATEVAIEHDLGQIAGKPSRHQRKIIENLSRLQRSLRGPENLLDRGGYSRPFPPAPPHQSKDRDTVLFTDSAS